MNMKAPIPLVENYILVVSVPIEQLIVIANKKLGIKEVEEAFIRMRDSSREHDKQVELDRARALFKYAIFYGAELEYLEYADGKLKVSLSFSSLSNMIEFHNTMEKSVRDLTMK